MCIRDSYKRISSVTPISEFWCELKIIEPSLERSSRKVCPIISIDSSSILDKGSSSNWSEPKFIEPASNAISIDSSNSSVSPVGKFVNSSLKVSAEIPNLSNSSTTSGTTKVCSSKLSSSFKNYVISTIDFVELVRPLWLYSNFNSIVVKSLLLFFIFSVNWTSL